MAITINGTGSITGISAGGLPDASIVTADIADANITAAKLSGAQSGSAPIYGCRAWVNFDGTKDTTGATSTANTDRLIRASGNVTSVLRNGAGDYTITFTTAMTDANYAVVGESGGTSGAASLGLADQVTARTTGLFRIYTFTTAGGLLDVAQINLAIFR